MLTYVFELNQKRPLYEQLYTFLRRDIETGRLKSGERLPSKRELASNLKVSVITVENAYGQLTAEGYIRPEARRGFFVQTLEPGPVKLPFSAPGKKFKDLKPVVYKYDFATNAVDTSCFPFSTWAKLMRELLSEGDGRLLSTVDPQGAYPLRKAIVRHLYEFRGIEAVPEQIVVGAGAEYLTGLLVQLLGREAGYAMENPGYLKIHKIIQKNGAFVLPISLDAQGLRMEELCASGARVVHITPSHHFPLGIVMPAARRMALLSWALESKGRYIIEDDYDSEFRFSGRPISALQGLDGGERVIYMNTFTKSLAPSFRIGYLVLPPHLLKRYREEFSFCASTVSSFEQYALARFMERGYFGRHISRMRNVYKARRDALIQAASTCSFSSRIELSGEDAGLHFLMRVKGDMPEEELVFRAKEKGVRVYGLSDYYIGKEKPRTQHSSTLVLGYAMLQPEEMRPAFSLLEQAWGY
ncbi:MAG: PLP-dependent aminotransferase family protein [Oscillospiraceae bacterium]|nr:PLP-dependent aminotransferase family protein [Oscillospiraceae bacterium]